MDKGFKVSIRIWLIILSIISLAALCRTFYKDTALAIDYSGILVGILAALCTVLIGWQIYSIIDFNQREDRNQRQIDSLKKIIKSMNENGRRGDYLLYDNLSNLYDNLLSGDDEAFKFERIHFKINAIHYASKIGEFDVCEIGINMLNLFVKKYNVCFDEDHKERLLKFACSIPNQNRIKNFTELINIIAGIKT
ncbi:hypothetical protein [Muribaculum intestinale]|uniref:hypothetical protein n=1 Tax=Muribaculum intestinale TaxID=1796646 RepID=UPI0025A9B04E|nr:hypothetical protein [Muribaculum intestinale]